MICFFSYFSHTSLECITIYICHRNSVLYGSAKKTGVKIQQLIYEILYTNGFIAKRERVRQEAEDLQRLGVGMKF